jgi:hypothetical protein
MSGRSGREAMKAAREWALEGAKFALVSSSLFEDTFRQCQIDALRHAAELCRKTVALNQNANADWRAIAEATPHVLEAEAAKLEGGDK